MFLIPIIGIIFNISMLVVDLIIIVLLALPIFALERLNDYFGSPRALFTKRKWIVQLFPWQVDNDDAPCPSYDLYLKFSGLLKDKLKPEIEYVTVTHSKIIALMKANPEYIEFLKEPEYLGRKNIISIKKMIANKNCSEDSCKRFHKCRKKDKQKFYFVRFKIKPSMDFKANYPRKNQI